VSRLSRQFGILVSRPITRIALLLAVPIAKFVSLWYVRPFRGIEPSHVPADLSCMPMENYHNLNYVPNCELNNEFMNLSGIISETASFKTARNGIPPIFFRAQTSVGNCRKFQLCGNTRISNVIT
jgi:hypothetical protein